MLLPLAVDRVTWCTTRTTRTTRTFASVARVSAKAALRREVHSKAAAVTQEARSARPEKSRDGHFLWYDSESR